LLLENGRLDSKAPLRSERHIEDRQRLVVATEALSFFEVVRCAFLDAPEPFGNRLAFCLRLGLGSRRR
jgi:hypothetical protein